MFKRILVALEPTTAAAVFDQTLGLAQTNQASLLLIHIFSALEEGYAGAFYPGIDTLYPTLHNQVLQNYAETWNLAEQQNLEWLKSLAQKAQQAGVNVEFSQSFGEAGHIICEVARNWKADLIVVGRRGKRGLSELLLGSVSNYMLHHAPCSVLTLQGLTQPLSSNQDGTVLRSAAKL
jgi:nucleotide-binding universal stress UspA family protein